MSNSGFIKKLKSSELFSCIMIAAGLVLCALAYNLFLIPNDIAAGGFTGASQLINSFTGWPVGIVMLCMNLPLFIISVKTMGKKFAVKSLAATILLSVLIDTVHLKPVAEDVWLATLYGGLLSGAGFGLILYGNATTGGTDMLASLIHKFIPSVSVGTGITIFDGIVILASAFVFNAVSALYALIAAVICNAVIDFVLEGPNAAHAFFIISEKDEAIADRILKELERGVTAWDSVGMYTGKDKKVLLCVVSRRESVTLRRLIRSEDPDAFIISAGAHETYGEGFKPLK